MRKNSPLRHNLLVCILLMAMILFNCLNISRQKYSFALRNTTDNSNLITLSQGLEIEYEVAGGPGKWNLMTHFEGLSYYMESYYGGNSSKKTAEEPPAQKELPEEFLAKLPQGTEVLYWGSNAAESCGLLVAKSPESCPVFYVLDEGGKSFLQQIELSSAGTEISSFLVNETDAGPVLVFNDKRLMGLYEVSAGQYALRIDAAIDANNSGKNDGVDEYPFWYGELANLCAFDGNRVAKVYFTVLPGTKSITEPHPVWDCGVAVIIYNNSGIVYCASLDTGLDRCVALDGDVPWTENPVPLPDSVQLRWTE